MLWLYAVQFAAPLILVGWLVGMPAGSGLGCVVQVFGSFAALVVMALHGICLLPPWWMPFVFAVALGLAVWVRWHSVGPFVTALPVTWGTWVVVVLFIALGTASTYGTVIALQSRDTPAVGVVNLTFPLEPGRYLVVTGGSNFSTNLHSKRSTAGFLAIARGVGNRMVSISGRSTLSGSALVACSLPTPRLCHLRCARAVALRGAGNHRGGRSA
ncbi:MAG: hypothetical protein ABIZ64_11635 [Casimicrobium sp.]|jgi:hypothetical protein